MDTAKRIPGAPTAQSMDPHPSEIPDIGALLQTPKLWVAQKLDWLELFANYDVSNQYEVFLSAEHQAQSARWLYAKEKSDCLQRVCIPMCREFTMDIGVSRKAAAQTMEEQMGLVSSDFVYPMVRLHRPCFFCLSHVDVQDGRNNGAPIGTLTEECTNLVPCCPIKIGFASAGHSTPTHNLEGPGTCLIGLIGQCPCRNPFNYEVKEISSGRKVGTVANVPNGWCKMCFTNADNYEVMFEESATAEERAMLLGSCFMLDYRFFEAKQKKNQNNGISIGY